MNPAQNLELQAKYFSKQSQNVVSSMKEKIQPALCDLENTIFELPQFVKYVLYHKYKKTKGISFRAVSWTKELSLVDHR